MGRIITFKCIPIRKTFSANDSDYKIYSCKSRDSNVKYNSYDSISIKGKIHELPIGVEHKVTAEEESSARYGYSYNIKSIERELPNDESSTRMFLQEILTRQQVDVLMDVYPDIVDRVMNDRLDDIDLNKTKGIKEYTFNVIKDKIIENFAISRAIIEFGNLIDFKMLKKLYTKYKSTRMIKVKLAKEPYEALCRLSRVGFKTADSIMLELERRCRVMEKDGKEPPLKFTEDLRSSKDRMSSAIEYVLSENEKSKQNTRMALADLKRESNALVRECMPHFVTCIKESMDVLHIDSDGYISRKSVYEKGLYIAGKILTALENPVEWNMDTEKYRTINGDTLTDEQFGLLEGVKKNNIIVFKGYPGTGKSKSTEHLVQMLNEYGKSIMLLAPTGRASKQLQAYTNHPSNTVHRGLGFNGEWSLNHFKNIIADVVLMDESSMADLDLFYRMISAINFNQTKLILVGDPAQLPSVSAGNVYHDLINSNVIPTVTLTKVFRYGIGGISTVCTDIREGKMYIPKDLKQPLTIGEDKGFMFLPTAKSNTVKTTLTLYKALLNKGYKPSEILVLSSQNVGAYGTRALNTQLQKIANEKNIGSEFYIESTEKKDATRYYIDDLIIQTSNNYNAKKSYGLDRISYFDDDDNQKVFVPNGDIGVVKDINQYKNKCELSFDENVLYQKADLNDCLLGYSISTHKSQGSQSKVIIAVTPRAHMHMLSNNLLYVMMTRAQEKLFQIGEPSSLPAILKKKDNLTRETNLPQLLKKKNRDKVLTKYKELVTRMEEDERRKFEAKKHKEEQKKSADIDWNGVLAREIENEKVDVKKSMFSFNDEDYEDDIPW